MRRVLLPLLVIIVVGLAVTALYAADEPQGGTLTGVLTAKGENWIQVRADGATESVKYLPIWHEGGFDKAMLETIHKLRVPNRVTLTWQMQEHPRIVSVEMLVPEEKEGTTTGVLTAKGENWIEVTPEGGAAQRYMPRWVGGAPNQGGGFDKDILRAFAELTVGQKVTVKWKYDERLRALEVHAAE